MFSMTLAGKKIHFMGIGGIGVSALAEMALRSGAVVSGCDRSASGMTDMLVAKGIDVAIGHDPRHVRDTDLLVYSSAVPEDHPERVAAGARQEMRGRFLARFIDRAEGVGVAGTHGKTTTTWLLAHILIHAGKDPSVYVGGVASALPDGNYRIGSGPFVSELDESDGSFLLPRLKVAILTNIESDHLRHYRNDEALFNAFEEYAGRVTEAGVLIAGVDSPRAAKVFAGHQGRRLSFGFASEADLRARICAAEPGRTRFDVDLRGRSLGRFTVCLPGRHNVQNSLAALGAALELGVRPEEARLALESACGVGRRMERLGDIGSTAVYSDYAHHPTEVAAAIEGVRQRHEGRILVVFQPHLYSRTRDYAEDFGKALAASDAVLLTDIYPAREEPIEGVTADLLAAEVGKNGTRTEGPVPLERIAGEVDRLAREFEAVVMMGAGSIDAAAREMLRGRKQ